MRTVPGIELHSQMISGDCKIYFRPRRAREPQHFRAHDSGWSAWTIDCDQAQRAFSDAAAEFARVRDATFAGGREQMVNFKMRERRAEQSAVETRREHHQQPLSARRHTMRVTEKLKKHAVIGNDDGASRRDHLMPRLGVRTPLAPRPDKRFERHDRDRKDELFEDEEANSPGQILAELH